MSNLAIGATYSSNTLHVGDGTWDSERNTYLLPPLVGVNFATMRLNGMGNRFKDFANYHQLILAHGVLAAMVFLFIVPGAIMTARFHTARPYWALRLHIWLQVLTVILTTILFILGWVAVGPKRKLTNPHHGIGLALFIFVLLQFIGGLLVYHRESRARHRTHIPFRLMIHQWFGRMIALLGIAQIPLGLYLYGSPKYLFILYTLMATFLLLTYLILAYRKQQALFAGGSDYSYSSHSGSHSHHGGGIGGMATAAAAGVGLAALAGRRGHSHGGSRTSVVEDHRDSHHSDYHDEKPKKSGFGKKLLEGGAVIGALALAKNLFGGKKHKADTESSYTGSEESSSMIDNRRAGPGVYGQSVSSRGPGEVLNAAAVNNRRPDDDRSRSSGSYSYDTASRPRSASGGHGGLKKIGEAAAAGGAFGFMKRLFSRKGREDPKIAAHASRSGNLTGDGRRSRPTSFVPGQTEVLSTADRSHAGPDGLAAPAGVYAAGALSRGQGSHPGPSESYVASAPPLPLGGAGQGPAPLPRGEGAVSEEYFSTPTPSRHDRSKSHLGEAALAGGAAGLAGAALSSHPRSHSRSRSGDLGHAAAGPSEPPPQASSSFLAPPAPPPYGPPLATVSVKPHPSGRKVTVRHLPDSEAQQRSRPSGPRPSGARSASSGSSAGPSGAGTWRRRRPSASDLDDTSVLSPMPGASAVQPPPPPPGGVSPSGVTQQSGVASDGTPTGTVASGTPEDRRRRRRAERARNASGGGGGGLGQGTVDWN